MILFSITLKFKPEFQKEGSRMQQEWERCYLLVDFTLLFRTSGWNAINLWNSQSTSINSDVSHPSPSGHHRIWRLPCLQVVSISQPVFPHTWTMISSAMCRTGKVKTSLKKYFIYSFSGREGKKHQCVVASCAPPTRDLACNPGMCPDW